MKKGKIINILNIVLFLGIVISIAAFIITTIIRNINLNKVSTDLGGSFSSLLLIFSPLIIFLIWEGIILFLGIKSFKNCNLENKYFYTSFILNIIVIIIAPLALFLSKPAPNIEPEQGAFFLAYVFMPILLISVLVLLIASIIFLVGYKKNKI